jgi:chromosome segregation ATPase
LAPPQEVDISGQLAALHSTIEKMQRQANIRAREQEDARIAQELRLQQLEQHRAASTASFRQLEQQVDDSIAQQETDLNELAQTMREMMSQTVSRIADQFDAVQASLEEAAANRATDRAEQQHAGQALQDKISETRTWTEAHASSLRNEVSELIRAETQAAAAQAAEQAAMLSELAQRQIAFETKREAQADRLSSLEQAHAAAEVREAKGSQMIQEALTVWQQAMDEKLNDASSKFDEYKNYVRRLRHEMREMKEESDLTHAALMDALARELQGFGNGVALLQNDAAGCLGQLRKNNNQAGDKTLQPEVSSSSTRIT